jgi:hypothetical protein
MSGTFNWSIDYEWLVGLTATVTGPVSGSNAASNYGEVSVSAAVSGTFVYGQLPGGCYYFDANATAENPHTGATTTPQGARLGDLCFDNPAPPGPPPISLIVYANMNGATYLLSNETYPQFTRVTITAVAPSGWAFVGWSGDIISLSNPYSFDLIHATAVTANFLPTPQSPPPTGVENPNDNSGCPAYQNCNSPIVLNLGHGDYELTGPADPVTYVDASDPVWNSLLLWTDLNHDGKSQSTEILPINVSIVTAVEVDSRWVGRRDAFGNRFRYTSRAWIAHAGKRATPHPIYDIYFVPAP